MTEAAAFILKMVLIFGAVLGGFVCWVVLDKKFNPPGQGEDDNP